jgi:hypothetical protein
MENHASDGDYQSVAEELRRSGIATLFQSEHQLVVSTALPAFPGSSNSFWLRFHRERWHLVTWAPHVYQLPESADVVAVCLQCLRASNRTFAKLPEGLPRDLDLRLLNDKEAGPILG